MAKPLLYGTPLSHFSRKVRILLLELGVEFDFVRPPDLLAAAPETYGDNPVMRIPTLVHDGATVIDSDHIARYLVDAFDPQDRFAVKSPSVAAMNRLAVVHGIMEYEVTLILSKRAGLAELESVAYFRKLLQAIPSGLAWLNRTIDPDAAGFDYADIATISMWQHIVHYQLIPGLDGYPRLAARVERLMARDSVASTTPAASLAAAGLG